MRMRAFSRLILFCNDPLKYGTPVTFTGSNLIQVENTGFAETYPIIQIHDYTTRLFASLNDSTVEWSGGTTELELDLKNMIPSQGDAFGDAFKIPHGLSNISISTDASDVNIIVYPAWR